MSIGLIVTLGYSNGSLVGVIKNLVTMGYDISTIIPPTIPVADGIVGNQSTGNGINGSGTTGNGILTASTLNGGINGSGSL